MLPSGGLKSKCDGSHFCKQRAIHSALEYRAVSGGGMYLSVPRSVSLLLDTQVTQKSAQQLALKRLVILRNHRLPVLQIVIHQD